VAEQQHRLPGLASEVDLQMITTFLDSVEADFSPQARKFLCYGFGKTVDGGFVVTRRFDFDELADHRDDRVLTVGEISKTALGFDARAKSLFSRNAIHALVLRAKAILENNKFPCNGKGHGLVRHIRLSMVSNENRTRIDLRRGVVPLMLSAQDAAKVDGRPGDAIVLDRCAHA